MVLAATDSFAERNQGMTKQQALDSWLEIAPVARAAGLRAQVTISVSFGCPFEGEVDPQRVVDLALRAAEAEPLEIAIADTIGVAVPTQVENLVARLNRAMPKIPVRCHFHNTRNTGIANAYAAAQAGVRILDSSVAGIGGCPFAPNATGNVATDDLVYMLNRAGFSTGVNLNGLIETSRWLGTVIGRTLPSMVARAGGFPKTA
jgi:hydroxymethylglutaryl-CoA lyase